MTREILFRGFSADTGEWEYGDLLRTFNDKEDTYIIGEDVFLVATDSVGQFTGLTDAHGKKIFEGDIIIICGPYGDGSMGTAKIGEHAMLPGGELYNYGAYLDFFYEPGRAKGMRRQELLFWTREHDVKVIGNIYDNQELLET